MEVGQFNRNEFKNLLEASNEMEKTRARNEVSSLRQELIEVLARDKEDRKSEEETRRREEDTRWDKRMREMMGAISEVGMRAKENNV